MHKKSPLNSASVSPRALVVLVLCAAACLIVTRTLPAFLRSEAPANVPQRTLTFAERVAYQRAIEDVYWRHRIWPRNRWEQPDPKPSLDAVMSQAQLEKKVADYLRKSQALEHYWQRPITAQQLQAEMDRMAKQTKQPEALRELFEALGNDPFVIAECLARPALSECLVTNWCANAKEPMDSSRVGAENQAPNVTAAATANYTLPTISDGAACVDDTWTVTSTTNAPTGRLGHTAVWTGSEMIVWGGGTNIAFFNTGARYNPATDAWTATNIANAPAARSGHVAVWTGNEIIIWGGTDLSSPFNTGARYNPTTDSWMSTSTVNAPSGRYDHSAVWTGTGMIVWGGTDTINSLNTGGSYNPSTDSWTATSTTNPPDPRESHTAVWTGTEMIVWGGFRSDLFQDLNTGGRYNPNTNSWTPTSINNVPDAREDHTAVWSGSEMIIWGGSFFGTFFDTGGRYNPDTNSWIATSTINAPDARRFHPAVWAGSEMIVWGGQDNNGHPLNTGGRYNPTIDGWTAMSLTNAPNARFLHTAVWTGSEMIVWGGDDGNASYFNTGGRYCGQSGPPPSPTPTPTPTATPTPCTGRCTPTPRPRPTPAPRPSAG
jgi:N-acetylneuraminic acid mutarotase